jgi:hypothetical protein
MSCPAAGTQAHTVAGLHCQQLCSLCSALRAQRRSLKSTRKVDNTVLAMVLALLPFPKTPTPNMPNSLTTRNKCSTRVVEVGATPSEVSGQQAAQQLA